MRGIVGIPLPVITALHNTERGIYAPKVKEVTTRNGWSNPLVCHPLRSEQHGLINTGNRPNFDGGADQHGPEGYPAATGTLGLRCSMMSVMRSFTASSTPACAGKM